VDQVHGAMDRWRCQVHGGPSGRRRQWCGGASLTQGVVGVAGLRSSPVETREGEGNEAVPMRSSPEHGQQQRSGAMAMEDGGGSSMLHRC
jgi:hypothetical protein